MKQDLTVGSILGHAVGGGVKYILPIAINYILWILTIWVPYINIGTTIAVSVGLPVKAGRGEAIPFNEVFNPAYRKQMGNYFLVSGLAGVGIVAGLLLFIVPGIVLSYAWILGVLIAVDQGENPLTALTRSYEATDGKKWTIFLAYLVLGVVYYAVVFILTTALTGVSELLLALLIIVVAAAAMSFFITALGYVYQTLDGGRTA